MTPKIGIALSGGGTRGLAHIGVLQVLEENQVPIDALAGTSMGGMIAGLYAAGLTPQELIDFSETVGIVDLAAPDLKWRGLFSHKKLKGLLVDLLGGEQMTFADLRVPTAVIAADIETGEMIVLDEGPLVPALMATCAFPLLFSPVRHGGRWLVDGGAVNNLPVDIVRAMGVDRVIGVSAPQRIELSATKGDETRGLSVRALSLFGNRTRNWRTPFLIAEASMGLAIQLVNQQRCNLCPPDVLIQIPLCNVGLFDNESRSQVIEAGRQAALQHLPSITHCTVDVQDESWWQRLVSLLARLRQAWAVLRRPRYQVYPEPHRYAAPQEQNLDTTDEASSGKSVVSSQRRG